MIKARRGNIAKIHIERQRNDGSLKYSTKNYSPLFFVIGEGKLIPALEEAVIGMQVGEKKTVHIPPEKAFGHRKERSIIKLEKYCIPSHIEPKVGMELDMGRPEDPDKTRVKIIEMTETHVTIDMNHPLAGENLIFNIELLSIK